MAFPIPITPFNQTDLKNIYDVLAFAFSGGGGSGLTQTQLEETYNNLGPAGVTSWGANLGNIDSFVSTLYQTFLDRPITDGSNIVNISFTDPTISGLTAQITTYELGLSKKHKIFQSVTVSADLGFERFYALVSYSNI